MTRRAGLTARLVLVAGVIILIVGAVIVVIGMCVLTAWLGYRQGVRRRR